MSVENNGALKVTDTEGRPIQYIYETQGGVIFHVTPINLATLKAIQLKAADKYPYPDPEPFQVPDPADVSFAPGQTSKAEDNPLYVNECKAVDRERKQWVDRTIFDYCVTCPKYPSREALVAGFRTKLDRLRTIATLPDDDYEAVLFHLVLTWNNVLVDSKGLSVGANEYGHIMELAIQTVALTPSEVAAGVRYFRPKVSGN